MFRLWHQIGDKIDTQISWPWKHFIASKIVHVVVSWTRQTPKLSLLFSIFLTYKLTPVIFAETWRYLSVWRRAVPSMWRVSGEKASWTTQNKGVYQQSRGLYILWWGGSPQQHEGKKYMSFTFTTSCGSRPSDNAGGRSSRPWDKRGWVVSRKIFFGPSGLILVEK